MGSKKLKAVAVRGSLDVALSQPREYLKYYHGLLQQLMSRKWVQALGKYGTPLLLWYSNAMGFLSVRNHQATTLGEEGEKLSAASLERYSTGMVACFGCPAHCRHRYLLQSPRYPQTRGEGPEYGSIGSLGANLGNTDLENVLYATELCNRYGLDSFSTGAYIGMAIELYQREIITEKTTGIPLSWGDGESIVRLIHLIAQRRGFGEVLAEGSQGLRSLSKEASPFVLTIKNMPLELTDERAVKSFALGIATATRGCDHMRSRPALDVINLPREVLEQLYGREVEPSFTSCQGRARMVWWHELLNAVCDSIGSCRFLSVFSSPHALQFPEFSQMVQLSTGLELSPQALHQIGERIYTLERLYITRLGIARKDDTLPSRYLEEPVPSGPSQGQFIPRQELNKMLDEYYLLHRWDREGRPTEEGLRELEINPLPEVYP